MDEHPGVDLLFCGGYRIEKDKKKPIYVPPGVNYGKSTKSVFIRRYSGRTYFA